MWFDSCFLEQGLPVGIFISKSSHNLTYYKIICSSKFLAYFDIFESLLVSLIFQVSIILKDNLLYLQYFIWCYARNYTSVWHNWNPYFCIYFPWKSGNPVLEFRSQIISAARKGRTVVHVCYSYHPFARGGGGKANTLTGISFLRILIFDISLEQTNFAKFCPWAQMFKAFQKLFLSRQIWKETANEVKVK